VLEQLDANKLLQCLDNRQPFCKLTLLGLRARHLHGSVIKQDLASCAGRTSLPCALPASSVTALPVLKGSARGPSGLFLVHQRFWLHRLGWLVEDHDTEQQNAADESAQLALPCLASPCLASPCLATAINQSINQSINWNEMSPDASSHGLPPQTFSVPVMSLPLA
jgi:hypothetical protein